MYQTEGKRITPMGAGKEVKVAHEIKLHKTYSGVFSTQFNFDGTLLAMGFGNGGIELFNPVTGEQIKGLREGRQGGFAIMCLRFHPKNNDILYGCTSDGLIYVYNCVNFDLVETIAEKGNEINSMDFCVDGYNFVTGGKDLNIRVYETNKNRLLRTYEGYNEKTVTLDQTSACNTMRVFSIKFHPNNQFIFISGGWDNHIKIWDIRDNDGIKRNISGPHIAGDTLDMKENQILSGQWAALHALQCYDYTSGKVVDEVKFPHKDGAFIYTAQYLNSTTVMAGGSGTHSLEVLELGTNRHIGGYKMDGPVHSADSANNGRVIAVGGAHNSFAILNMTD